MSKCEIKNKAKNPKSIQYGKNQQQFKVQMTCAQHLISCIS
jgi:hypothetical protein